MGVLVDTNVLIDILTDDSQWADWSEETMGKHVADELAINPAIYTELCFGCDSVSEADAIVRRFGLSYLEIPRDGLFRAAKAFAKYKAAGGPKQFVLPDFFVGGHAEASSLKLITRDTTRYETYFPGVDLIHP